MSYNHTPIEDTSAKTTEVVQEKKIKRNVDGSVEASVTEKQS